MKSETRIFALASVATLICVVIWFYQDRGNETASNHNPKTDSTPKPNKAAGQPVLDQKTKTALQMLANGIKNMGWREVPPVQDRIQQAIASKDSGEILRAFHEAVYSQGSRMADSIPAIKAFLSNPDPWVRYEAAEDLYIAGDNSGFDALVGLLQTDHPLRDGDGDDIRTQAAQTLEKYREKRAINALIDYCRETGALSSKNSGFAVLDGLAKMAKSSLPADLTKIINDHSEPIYVMYNLSFINPQMVTNYAQNIFGKSKDGSEAKTHAAWALLKAGVREPCYSYLMGFAQKAIIGESPPITSVVQTDQFALKILASIKDPETKVMLESALAGKNTQVIEIALVNLFYNQGGSEKARQYLLNKFNGPTNLLDDSDFLMRLAAALNDPQINAAAASSDQRDGGTQWAYYEDRKDWSVYTWIDDYVVDLNGSREVH